jgi:hypothetical protein
VRNAARFPEDFTFRLAAAKVEALNRSQFVTGSQKHRDRVRQAQGTWGAASPHRYVRGYLDRIDAMKRTFARLAAG